MRVSFIIPAHNEEQLLPRTLDSIHEAAKALTLSYEVIVADDASTDATADVAKQHGTKVVRVEHRQIAKTRNSGAAQAEGDVLIFVDADTSIDRAVLQSVMDQIEAGAVGGGAGIRFDGRLPLYGRLLQRPLDLLYHRLAGYAYGCFIYCTREAFEAVGGFDETLFAGEEVIFSRALRRRDRFVLVPETVLTSGRKLRTYSFGEALMMLVRFVLGGGFRYVKKRDHLDLWYGERREDNSHEAANELK